MSTLILLRHGQARFGADNYDQLTPLGELQAAACGAFWQARGVKFSKVLIGPRERHARTARLALENLPLPIIEQAHDLDEFAEASDLLLAAQLRTGIKLTGETGRAESEVLRHYGEQIRLWTDDTQAMLNIERVGDFRRRIRRWLDNFADLDMRGQQVLAVTSGGVIAAVIGETFGLSNAAMASVLWNIQNCSMTAMGCSRKGHSIRYFNSTAHFPPDLQSRI